MEIGHNVLHGQWDWMRDPKIHSTTWEWDHASPPEQWKRAHNERHHTYTNIVGKDNDLGYGIMRVDEAQEWQPRHLVQPLWNLVTACIFEWGIAMYDLDLGDSAPRQATACPPETEGRGPRRRCARPRKQVAKDYVLYPALSGRRWRSTLAANATANLARNLWSHSVIMCGHFPEGVETFERRASSTSTRPAASGTSGRCSDRPTSPGPPLLHLMTGNLSHQIEHHLFPDLPSNRYAEIAVEVERLFQRYGLSYHSAPLLRQVGSAWHKVVRLSLPNGWLAETHRRNLGSQLAELARLGTASTLGVLQHLLSDPERGVGVGDAAVDRGLQQDLLDLVVGEPVAERRAQVHGELLVVAAGDERGQGDQRAAAPVEARPGPDAAPGVLA